ncbi:unnamed protein product [Prorocentrum cordatum]|uniref:Reverse transcriptase domain-containing protein n=1 Tax=Prorocentrum cordatum TaxID=2364126 RepID=A0ABN9U850_9DINO|nr:unnamed protein product [Polarella glacialis]
MAVIQTHCEDWARCCAITLNELDRGSADPHPQGQRASAGQERSLGMIQAAVAELGRPPADLTRQGALAELLAKRSYTGEKVSSALKRPYYDPSLQGRPRRHARLLAALDGAGVLEWRRHGSPRVGLFTVWKKNGKQRLIVDARLSNLCFASPDSVDLATGGSFASLEVDPGPPVCLAQVDIQDAFYHLLLPPELVPFFCLRPVTAGLAGVVELDGAPVSPTQLVYPHLRVVPMGWNHALWWCQRIHEFHASRQPGVSLSNKLSDKKPGVRLGRSGFAHTEYVDNFAAIGRQAKEVDAVADSVLDALTAAGLSMHPRESSVGGSVLGWGFSDERPQVRVSPRRAWRPRLGIEGLLEKGFATGRDLEAIIGHFTFAARIRPEALCVFSAAYAFSQRGADTRRRLWTASIAEAGRWSDRWRFSRGAEDRVRPRDASLREELNLAAAAGLDDLDRVGTARHLEALGGVDRSGAVPEIGPEILQGSWATVSAGRWKRREAMPILEGRALVWGVRHVSRGLSEFGKRILFLIDGLSEVLALEKGRSSSVALMRVCRQWAATVFAADLYPRVRWIRSELNVCLSRMATGAPIPSAPWDAALATDSLARPGGAAERRPVQGEPPTLWRAAALSQAGARPRPPHGRARAKAAARQAKPRPEELATRGERAAARQANFPVDKRATVSEGLSLLERESAGDHDQRVCQSALAEFRIFSETLGLRLETAQDYDEAAVEWTYLAVFDGSDALEGTRRLGSPRSQLPLPGEVACAVAHRLAANQDLHAARLVFVSFVFGLQPAELMSLTGRQVAPPARAAGHAAWSLVLFPMEEETPSKDGAFNGSVLGDLPFCHLIGDVLKPLEAGVNDRDLMAQVRYAHLAQAFGTADQRLGLESPPRLYLLRRGGAPVDLASYRRSIAEVRARSRWASDSSATGYGKGGRVAGQLTKLPPPFLDHAIVRAKKNGGIPCEHCRGSGNFSRAWRRRQRALGDAIFEWDIRWGDEYDLTRQRAQRLVRGWVNNGLIAAVWLGTPCHSWSRARDIRPGPPPLRSDLHVMGLPDLAPRDAEKVRIGNALMKFSASRDEPPRLPPKPKPKPAGASEKATDDAGAKKAKKAKRGDAGEKPKAAEEPAKAPKAAKGAKAEEKAEKGAKKKDKKPERGRSRSPVPAQAKKKKGNLKRKESGSSAAGSTEESAPSPPRKKAKKPSPPRKKAAPRRSPSSSEKGKRKKKRGEEERRRKPSRGRSPAKGGKRRRSPSRARGRRKGRSSSS